MDIAQQSRVMTAPVMRAWFEALEEWESADPSSADDNVAAIDRHYGVAEGVSILPPTRLLVEWREAGHPDPIYWVKEKLVAILEDGSA